MEIVMLVMLTVFILFVTYRMDTNEKKYAYDNKKTYEDGFREGFKKGRETEGTIVSNTNSISKRSKR